MITTRVSVRVFLAAMPSSSSSSSFLPSSARAFTTLQDQLGKKERVEENRWIRVQEKEAAAQRKAAKAKSADTQAMEDEELFMADEDLRHNTEASAEALRDAALTEALRDW